jgi:hypothetical protein
MFLDAGTLLKGFGAYVGLGVGTIDIQLVRNNVRFGECVDGRVQLKLRQALEGEKLAVGIRCTQQVAGTATEAALVTTPTTIYDFCEILDGPCMYRDQGYDVHFRVPTSVRTTDGDWGDPADAWMGRLASAPRWSVYACLHMPWKRNLKASVDLSVR